MSKLELVITPRERDLGGFHVKRILPYATHRMVGPFIFLDHMGPAEFGPGEGMDVRPHPHINLATVTYLFEGSIFSSRLSRPCTMIEPGAINWMTAGKGITHSERTPPQVRQSSSRVHGLQCWVALPRASEEIEPSFTHHPSSTLPEFQEGPAQIKVLVGQLFGRRSPVRTESEVLYVDAKFTRQGRIEIPAEGRDLAVYLLDGQVQVNDEPLPKGSLGVLEQGDSLKITAEQNSRVMILGGEPSKESVISFGILSQVQKKELSKPNRIGARKNLPKYRAMTKNLFLFQNSSC